MKLRNIFKKKVQEEASPSRSILTYGGYSFASQAELDNSAFWCCVVNLARLYATLPLHPYERKKGSNVDVIMPSDSYLQELLYKPNLDQTGYDFRFCMGLNFELYGQAIAIIERGRTGLPLYLWPVAPSTMIAHAAPDGSIWYRNVITEKEYKRSDLLIINNTPYNANNSVLSPMRYAKNDLDLAKACKQMQMNYYNGSSIIGNIITVPAQLNDEQQDRIKAKFDAARGFNNFVVKEGIKLEPLRVTTSDIDKLVSAQSWNTKEICRRFQVPPFIAGDTSDKYSNSEQQMLTFVQTCLMPRSKAWGAALTASLGMDRPGVKVKFNLAGLLEGDTVTRSNFYHTGINDGWLTINEVREKEDLPPVPYGDTPLCQMNLGSLENVVKGRYAPQPNPWDVPIPDDPPEEEPPKEETEEEHERRMLEERKAHDQRFIEAVSQPALTGRRKLEKLIKSQLKKEIDELNRLIATGQPVNDVLGDWKAWLETNAEDMTPTYRELYYTVLKQMVPIVQQEADTEQPVNDSDMDDFLQGYSSSMAHRHAGEVYKQLSGVVGTETMDDTISTVKSTLPAVESKEEAHRARGAFSVFLYSSLGITLMRVVANADACSFCSSINGRIVEVNGSIVKKGTDEKDTDGTVVHIKKSLKHPPFHPGCECFVVPEKKA